MLADLSWRTLEQWLEIRKHMANANLIASMAGEAIRGVWALVVVSLAECFHGGVVQHIRANLVSG